MSKNIDKAIADGNRLFLMYGHERYMLEKSMEKVINHFLKPEEAEFNLEIVESLPKDIFEVINSCNTLPFMGEYRVVVLKDTGIFEHKDKTALEKLTEEVNHMPDTTVLIIREQTADKRKKLYKLFQTKGYIEEQKNLSEEQIGRFLAKWFDRYGSKRIKVSAIKLLIQRVGVDLTLLLNECEKLVNYAESEITDEMVIALVSEQLESKIFALTDALGKKNQSLAIENYRIMLQNREPVNNILFRITAHFERLYQVKLLQEKRMGRTEMAVHLGIKPYAVEKLSEQTRLFSKAELERVLKDLTQFEWDYKRGRIDPVTGLELLLQAVSKERKEEHRI